MKTVEIMIEGMHCGGCVQRAGEALRKVSGVETRKVEIGKATVDLEQGREAAAVEALERIGFDARIAQA